MVRFDNKLRANAVRGWEEYYVDYAALKRLLYVSERADGWAGHDQKKLGLFARMMPSVPAPSKV
jgi:SPX domain protein involved in polyphosphate accumulation